MSAPADPAASSEPRPIRRTREVLAYGTRFGTLFNDDVLSPAGAPGQYLRWQWSCHGVVAVPVRGERVAFVPAFRYPVARVSLEFPRGGAELGESLLQAACRELVEETGLVAVDAAIVGTVHAETALIETPSSVVRVLVTEPESRPHAGRPDDMESFAAPVWLDRRGVVEAISTGQITCGLSLAALALLWL